MTTAPLAMGTVENVAMAVRRALAIPLSLSPFLPLLPSSPRLSLPLFLATARGQKGQTQAKKVRRGGARLVTYL